MCTLVLGLGILGPGTLLLGANRDESPDRPASGPDVLVEKPRVVGGRDLVSWGTWLAVREARFVTALMNRRPDPDDARDPATLRSRGLLCLEVAAAPSTASSFLDVAFDAVQRDRYGHCTLIGVGVDLEAWSLHAGWGEPTASAIPQGWHVITHRNLDDPEEPRTAWLLDRIRDLRPGSVHEAVDRLAGFLKMHGEGGSPAVCLHRNVFPTVSSSILALGDVPGGPCYFHAAGPPCVTPYVDHTKLLIGAMEAAS